MLSDLSAIRERGYAALTKELGSSGMAVFIRHYESGSGNYTAECEELVYVRGCKLWLHSMIDSIASI